MMRRGPLDRYPVEWVLRQASSSRANGCIQFHGPEPMTVFFDDGQIAAAVAGISSEDPGVLEVARAGDDEDAARAATVAVLSTRLAGRTGWYYHDPLEHGAVSGWSWSAAQLLLDARMRSREDRSMADWDGRRVTVRPNGEGITLGADGLAVVAALAQALPAAELRVRLGWDGTRLAAALEELDRSGALSLPGARPVHDDLHETVRAAEQVLAAVDGAVDLTDDRRGRGPSAAHRGPLTPPPVLAQAGGDLKGGFRRLRSARR